MLFNSLYAPESGVDILQVVAIFPEHVNLPAFTQSLTHVIQRHDILRTAFRWEGLSEPLQEVAAHVPLPLTVQDWRDQAASTHQDMLDAYVRADRRQGFTLNQAPLLRVTVIQLADADYRLVFTLHHAILDGRSLLLMLKELFASYEANCNQQELHLPPPRPYRDYIAWTQQQDLSADQDFWRELLKGFTTPTQLTIDHQQRRLDDRVGGYDQQQIFLSAAATDGLTQLALAHDLTVHTLVQAAWALLLSRYSSQDDVVFGVTRSCRYGSIEGVESMLGLFINTLPLRVRIDPDLTVLAWLKELRAQNMAIRDHQQASLVQVQQWSEIPQGTPLFNTLLVFERQVMEAALKAQGGQWLNRSLDLVRQPNYPLTLGVFGGPQLLFRIVYDQQHFDAATIGRMLEHVQLLLEAMVVQPDVRIAELPSLPPAQWQQLMDWNATEADYPDNDIFHVRFDRHASRTPDAVAVLCGDTQLTYQELNSRANQLAHHLRALGVGCRTAEVRVGLYLRRSVDLIIGLLGTLKAGGVYLPLDPAYPADRLQFMLQDAAPTVVLTESGLLPTLPAHPAQVVVLDRDAEVIARQPTISPPTEVTPDHLAYMIYTSGSTGTPKGTLLAHRGLCNVIAVQAQTFGVQPGQTALQFASLNFDASIFEIVMALGVGARLLLAPPDLVLGPALVDLLREQVVSIVTLTPSTLAMLPPATLPALHTITVAGEVCPPDLVDRWAPGRRFFNLYGPTEATIWTSYALCTAGQPPHIGRPIANTEAYVLNGHGQPVPLGVAGELYLGGIGLARGYHNRPDLTATRFVPNPFSSIPGSRLYRTGDLACYLPDGNLMFLGRQDHQVKLRGFRIELGEIEAALRRHPALDEAVVLLHADHTGNQRLVAYVVENKEQTNKEQKNHDQTTHSCSLFSVLCSPQELRAFLRETLPEYMVPNSFIQLNEIPLTPSGKIDRSALSAIQSPSLQLQSYTAPRTPVEEVLLSIWTEVLKLPPRSHLPSLGIHDHFFTLGGHSLLAMQVIFRTHEVFQVDLTLQHLFEAPTIHQLAEVIETAKRSTVPLRTPAIVRLDRSRHVKRT